MNKGRPLTNLLKFQSTNFQDYQEAPEESLEKTTEILQNLYEKIVPEYLIEDHPPEIPETALKLIKKEGKSKGNGMPAEQLDQELAILFRNNERNNTKK